MNVTPVILAGGRSERMGSHKWALVVDGMPLLELEIRRILAGFPKVVVVTRETEQVEMLLLRVKKSVRIVKDEYTQVAPIYGIRTALGACGGDGIFAIACDMPFVTASAIEHVIAKSEGFDACYATNQGRPEPLFCFYSNSCITKIDEFIKMRENSLIKLLNSLHTNHVESTTFPRGNELLFTNLNTPQDLRDHLADIRAAIQSL